MKYIIAKYLFAIITVVLVANDMPIAAIISAFATIEFIVKEAKYTEE